MRKLIFIFLCLLAIPLTGQADSIDLQLKAPSTVIAGTKFEVTLYIIKGDLSDFSRFAQELPAGFTATNVESPNAHFVFNDKRIRLMWLKLPPNDTIVVKYAITPYERLKGTLELAGTFGYISNGERAFKDLDQIQKVDILPNPNIDPSLIVDIADFGKVKDTVPEQSPVETKPPAAYATIVRQRPVVDENGNVYVSLLVNNPKESNFLKIEEQIPDGYTFEAVDAHDGVISKTGSLARFVWMTPPGDEAFLVKYKLVPIPGEEQASISIEGNMSYSEDGQTKIESIREMEVNIDAMSEAQWIAFLSLGTIPAGLPVLPLSMQVGTELAANNDTETVTTTGRTDTNETNETNVVKEPESVTSNEWPDPNYEVPSDPFILGIEDFKFQKGVYFRVQVAAVRRPYFAKAYFAEYALLRDVKVERLNGWSKYTVGSCETYEEAVRLRDRIIKETPEKEAFIIAYKDNRRIDMSEAVVQ